MKSYARAFRSYQSARCFCSSVQSSGINLLSLAFIKRSFSNNLLPEKQLPTTVSVAYSPAEVNDWLNMAEPPVGVSDIARQIYFAYAVFAGIKNEDCRHFILPGLRFLQVSGAPRLTESVVSVYGVGQFVEKLQRLSFTDIKSDFWESEVGNELIAALVAEKPRAPVEEKRSTIEIELTEAAFRECYQGTDKILKPFIDYLNTCINNWDRNKVYAPLIEVVNSSMIGKSRMFDELPKAGIFTFTVCLRRSGNGGCPTRTPFLADWFSNSTALTRELEIYHIEYLKAFKNWIANVGNTDLPDLAVLWKIRQTMPDFYSELLNNVRRASSKHSDSTFSRMTELAVIQEDLLSIITSKTGVVKTGKKVRFLFVYDEAISLMEEKVELKSRLNYLRESFRIFPMNDQASFFSVVTDTNSPISLSQQAPPLSASEGARSLPERHFPPYWCIGSHDIWPDCDLPFAMQELSRPFHFSRYGRPFFHAVMKVAVASGAEFEGFTFLLDLLSRKLLGDEFSGDISKNRAAALAVLGTRLVLNVSAESKMASRLMSTHMRTCVAISEDRQSVYTMSRAEPMLALSALTLTRTIGWKKLLIQLSESIDSLQVLPSSRGEMGAQILFLMAFEKLLLKRDQQLKSFDMVPLSEFVSLMTGDEISGSHKSALEDRLARMFTRGAALALREGTAGSDLIIPVFSPPKDRDPYTVLVEPQWMSSCLIQVDKGLNFNHECISLKDDGIAIAVNGLRPSHIYGSDELDAVFASLVHKSFDPTSIKGLSDQIIKAIEQDMWDHYADEDDEERRNRAK